MIAGALTAFVSFPGRPLGADQPLELLQGGQFLAADSAVKPYEGGDWPYDRTVILAFPDAGKFEEWYKSSKYQGILPLRLNHTNCNSALVDGAAIEQLMSGDAFKGK